MSQNLLLIRTVTLVGGTPVIAYPKSEVSRGMAWDHLLQHPPDGVVIDTRAPFADVNPYRKCHSADYWEWRVGKVPEPPIKQLEARHFDPKIWKSTSSKYRMIARLPEGMTGRSALRWAMQSYHKTSKLHDHEEEWIRNLSDDSAASHFMRVYTTYPFAKHCQETLTREEWNLFRKAGGQAA